MLGGFIGCRIIAAKQVPKLELHSFLALFSPDELIEGHLVFGGLDAASSSELVDKVEVVVGDRAWHKVAQGFSYE